MRRERIQILLKFSESGACWRCAWIYLVLKPPNICLSNDIHRPPSSMLQFWPILKPHHQWSADVLEGRPIPEQKCRWNQFRDSLRVWISLTCLIFALIDSSTGSTASMKHQQPMRSSIRSPINIKVILSKTFDVALIILPFALGKACFPLAFSGNQNPHYLPAKVCTGIADCTLAAAQDFQVLLRGGLCV